MKQSLIFLSIFGLLFSGCTLPEEESPLNSYESTEYGFSFEYSDEWALSSDVSGPAVVQLALDEALLDGSNVSSASFQVNVHAADSLESCLNVDVDAATMTAFSEDETVQVNGTTYYISEGGEGTAGPDYTAEFKRSYQSDTCLEIVEGYWSSDISFYEGTDTVDLEAEVARKLNEIFESFDF